MAAPSAVGVDVPRGAGDVTLAFHCMPDIDWEVRAAAASAAGFRRVGVSARWFFAGPFGSDADAFAELLSDHDLVVGDVEVLTTLGSEGDTDCGRTLRLAERLGAPLIQVNAPFRGDFDEMIERYARTCDRAADHGCVAALEFLPWTAIPDLATAVEVVRRAGRENGGVTLDVWHHVRSGGEVHDVGDAWVDVVAVQVNDGPLRPQNDDLREECLHRRGLPGSGSFDLAALRAGATDHPRPRSWSIEVPSDDLRSLAPSETTARLASSLITSGLTGGT